MIGAQGSRVLESGTAVAASASATLEQCAALLKTVNREVYSAPSEALAGGTIGQHVRHSLDHFAAALQGAIDGHIDYDSRERGTSIESDPRSAVTLIAGLVGQMKALTSRELSGPVTVHVMLSGDGRRAALSSTIERELAFASHHAIHHHAMIRAIAREHGVTVAGEFGKAPATIDHERRVAVGR